MNSANALRSWTAASQESDELARAFAQPRLAGRHLRYKPVRHDLAARAAAAGKLIGIAEVPVIVAHGWTDQQKTAYVIADNRLTEASDWDDEMLRLELNDLKVSLTGITESELSRLSIGVGELEQMPELPDGDRSPYRDMTFILYGAQWDIRRARHR
jgi:hypothetical protein